ncbi:MAG TPA: cell surface protein SprA [Bacteroidales bacterium]|nr:MAG: cell surface protein SprA [Bacteroidetes bacterium GWF2_33_38]HBF88055.1 cell surface protein SprA [Bacteroidales bacterium]
MKNIFRNIFAIVLIASLGGFVWSSSASKHGFNLIEKPIAPPDTTKTDLPYEFDDTDGNPYENNSQSKLYMENPSNISTDVEYNPESNEYVFTNKIGDFNYRQPQAMSFEEYKDYDFNRSIQKYWQQKAKGESSQQKTSFIPKINVPGEVLGNIFGSNTIDIKPQGSAELEFGIKINNIDNPRIAEKERRTTTFDFQEKIQMNVTGQIGDKMKLSTNYNTEATFDFENKMNLSYDGKEDEIIKKIEAGDVNLPLTGTLITGSQSLFGIKTELQFGKMTVTSVFSQQKGKTQVIEVEGGAQTNFFEVEVDDYEANKHFFLSHYFYEHYEEALANLPVVVSGINITKIEVWVTNKSQKYDQARNIVAFMDLAEKSDNIYANTIFSQTSSGEYPSNNLNDLYNKMTTDYIAIRNIYDVTSTLQPVGLNVGRDFEKIENARMLESSEYKLNAALGYISLNSALNADEVLAVAYEYTIGGQSFKVGEFSNSGIVAPEALILKLIRGTSLKPSYPNWRLMMKNIYAIGAYQVEQEGFELNVMYQNDKTGKAINYIPEGSINGKVLLRVLNLDRLNQQNDPQPDGLFDFVDGFTVNTSNGRIIFPVIEPFGEYLRNQIGDDGIADKYVFEELYDSTQSRARQIAEKNKFFLTGKYSSSASSEISLNALNVPQGSVVVTAGGRPLTENQDYTVDYTLGRVKITNKGLLESGTPIKISLESNSLFAMQSKTLVGSHFAYKVSNDFSIGGTVLNLTERPMTQKVSIGDEPISNTIWGLDGTYRTEVPILTKLVDMIPFIDTKETSTITATGEFAHLIPGHSSAVEKAGISYIDDFEGTKTTIDIKSYSGWIMASTPQHQSDLFPEGSLINSLEYGFNRAKFAWYSIDPLFLRNNSATPAHIKSNPDLQSNHFVREVYEKEIAPNKDPENNIPQNIAVLNLAYYPEEKGPYNYDILPNDYSEGIDENGKLRQPKTRWGGIMRSLETNDFEEANIEYIEFWMMDPFVYDTLHSGGEFYINLGNVSEDVLKDSRKFFENGLPTPTTDNPIDTTNWGRVPIVQSIVNAFDAEENSRIYQDVGFDGLRDEDETVFFGQNGTFPYLDSIASVFGIGSLAFQKAAEDPSSDNFHYFKGSDYDQQELGIIERYKKYNLPEGNSPTASQTTEDYQTTGTITPDAEDINRDNTLSEAESYFQYRLYLHPDYMEVGQNFITDKLDYTVTFENNTQGTVSWYQFKVPITEYEKVVGDISDFKSIRFVRMFMRNFEDSIIVRLAKLNLVRGDWRKYTESFNEGASGLSIPEITEAAFDISSVNIEENGKKIPVNYVLPPGITRVIDPTNPQLRELNEQAIVLKVCNLGDGNAKAAYKNVVLDVRQYKRLQMFIHAEAVENEVLNDNDLCAFIRIGSDYQDNFYEYEVPLRVTAPGSYYNGEDDSPDRYKVWPQENMMDFEFELFQNLKLARNEAMRAEGSTVSYNTLYTDYDGNNKISISGNPNLSNIRTVLIGIRNRSKLNNNLPADDGLEKCAEIWMNELRLTEFDERGGWAANARVTTKLADFATVTLSGSTMKPGFGSIEKKVSERNKEEINQLDVSSNVELGKFFPEKAAVSIPMYVGYSHGVKNPQYDPLDPDIPFEETLNAAATDDEREEIKARARDLTLRKSLNFTNVKVGKVGTKPHLWDVSNFALNYSYSEIFLQNISTERNITKNFRGGLVYNFSTTPKEVKPFEKSKLFKSNAFRLIKDFNFYYSPLQLSVRTDLNRFYNETQLRQLGTDVAIDPYFNQNFLFNRYYDLKYNITKSLQFDFSATNQARIDEPYGIVNKDSMDFYKNWKDTVLMNLGNMGRNTQYHHTFNVSYTIPINKIPILNWVSASLRYGGNYDWIASPITADTTIKLGNTIKNSNTTQISGTLNMKNLYNKVKYLKTLEQENQKGKSSKKEKKTKKVTYEEKGLRLKPEIAKTINHNLKTEDVEVKAYSNKGSPIEGTTEIVNDKKIRFTSKLEFEDVRIVITGTKDDAESIFKIIADNVLTIATGIKNVNVTYSGNKGSYLPGFMPQARIMGGENFTPDYDMYGNMFSNSWAPGFKFISGFQDEDFARYAVRNGWLTNDSALNAAFAMTNATNIRGKVTFEPFKSFRLDITTDHSTSINKSEYYYADANNVFAPYSTMQKGTFSMSVISWNTAFDKIGKDGSYTTEAFEKFMDNRIIIAQRLAQQRADVENSTYNPDVVDEDGFPDGYSSSSQEVMSIAFLAAYTNFNVETMPLTIFPEFTQMRPNWNFTYNGLNNISFVKKYIKSANIRHSYRSSYNVGSFTSNLDYNEESDDGLSYVRDLEDNFISYRDVSSVSINEQFSPLVSLDLTWTNSLMSKVELKKSRNITMSLSNSQISEMKSTEFVVGLGYRIKDVEIYISSGGNKKQYKSDLNVRCDLSFKDNVMVTHKIEETIHQPTSGQLQVSLKNSADYVLSERFNLRVFFDYVLSDPIIQTSYKTSTTNFGVSVKFTLAQ